jgi:transcriptional regulator with XRE-family HTH domain
MKFDQESFEEALSRLEDPPAYSEDADWGIPDGDSHGSGPTQGSEPVPAGEPPAAAVARIMREVEHRMSAPLAPPPTGLALLGRYARRGRVLLGISQDRLSAQSGVSQSAISRFELARAAQMHVDRLVSIGEVLGRAFPLGYCPHHHRCALQPVRPRLPATDSEIRREQLVTLGLDLPFPRE